MSGLVEFRLDPDGIGVLTLDDEAGRNALSEPLIDALLERLGEALEDERVKVLVLAGGNQVFCAGATRELLLRLAAGEVAPTDIVLSKAILDMPVPVVAAMAGHAVGGGLALGLCADIVVLANESRYGASFMNMGFTPGMGMTVLLGHVMSEAMAHELLYTGEPKRGRELAGGTGINYVVPRDQVLPKAMDLAARIAEKPRPALVALKQALARPRREAFERSRVIEAQMHELTFSAEGIAALIGDNYVE
jgi:polyketide biosynthesis enoyl-CoA hydratase PksI